MIFKISIIKLIEKFITSHFAFFLRTFQFYSQQITIIPYSIFNHSHHVIHQILRPYSSFMTESLYPFYQPLPISLTSHHLANTILLSVSMTTTLFFGGILLLLLFSKIPHIIDTMQYLSFSLCLAYFTWPMSSRFIHLVKNLGISFFFYD